MHGLASIKAINDWAYKVHHDKKRAGVATKKSASAKKKRAALPDQSTAQDILDREGR